MASVDKFINSLKNVEPKKYVIFCLVLLAFFVTSFFLQSYKNSLKEEFEVISDSVEYVVDLKNNPHKLNFIKNHSFSGKKQNFKDFISTISNKLYSKINSFSEKDNEYAQGIHKKTIKIDLLFLHDSFVFQLIDQIKKFSPGFVYIKSFSITKIENVSKKEYPFIVEIICEQFYVQN